MVRYFVHLGTGKIILWCYLLWYLVTVAFYFDPSPVIWLNSAGVSAVVGSALLLGVSDQGLRNRDRWQVFRLFLTPFCVSSFSSLIKGHGYILIIPPQFSEQVTSVGLCLAFVFLVAIIKRFNRQ